MLAEALTLALSGMGTVLFLLFLLQGLMAVSQHFCERYAPAAAQAPLPEATPEAATSQVLEDSQQLEAIRAAVQQYREDQS